MSERNEGAANGRRKAKNYGDKPGCNGIRLIEDGDEWVIVGEHLYRTEDQRIVHENDLDGRWLAYPRGARISREEAVRMGLLKESAPEKPANKSRKADGTK